MPSPYNRRIDVWGVLATKNKGRIMRPGTRLKPSLEDAGAEGSMLGTS